MKIVLYAEVVFDGIGDYVHLEDIYQYLRALTRFKDAKFVVILDLYGCPDSTFDLFSNPADLLKVPHPHKAKIIKRLEALKGLNSSSFTYYINITPSEIESHLQDADYIASISSVENRGLGGKFEAYLPKIIQIVEHEVGGVYDDLMGIGFDREKQVYGMGLRDDQCGIKIANVPRITPDKAWKIVEHNCPDLARIVLESTHSAGFSIMVERYYIVPAYFNYNIDFLRFLRLVTAHESIQDKNFLVFHSGTNLKDTFIKGQERLEDFRINFKESVLKEFAGTPVRIIQIVRSDSVEVVFENGKQTGPTVSIFNGFDVNDAAYDALFQLATVAGVSGDNSFEKAVANGVFPYYKSTNFGPYYYPTVIHI